MFSHSMLLGYNTTSAIPWLSWNIKSLRAKICYSQRHIIYLCESYKIFSSLVHLYNGRVILDSLSIANEAKKRSLFIHSTGSVQIHLKFRIISLSYKCRPCGLLAAVLRKIGRIWLISKTLKSHLKLCLLDRVWWHMTYLFPFYLQTRCGSWQLQRYVPAVW